MAVGHRRMQVGKNEPVCIADEVPFEIPESWEWVRLSNVFSVINGDRGKNYPAKSTLSKTGIPFISALNLDGKTVVEDDNLLCLSDEQFNKLGNGKLEKDDVVVCIRGSLGKHGRYPFEKGAIASSLVILRPHMNLPLLSDFIMMYLDSPVFFSEIKKYDNGTAQPNLAAKSLEMFFVPLPPLNEQDRILQKLAVVSPSIDEYQTAFSKLTVLNDTFSDELKKSILQEAVQGKLVPQDPADEPAYVLLERIRAEKEQLIKAGKIKRDKHESVIFRRDNSHYEKRGSEVICIDDTIPFDIPDTWAWVRLRSVLEQASTGPFGSMLHKDDYTEKGIPIVNPANIADRRVIEYKIKRVSNETADRLKSYMLHSGDVIIGRRGEMGRSAVVLPQQEGWLCGTGCFYVTPLSGLSPEYLSFLLSSPYIRNALTDNSVGTTMNNLNHNILGDLLIPLPPVNEQIQIMQQYKNVINIFGD